MNPPTTEHMYTKNPKPKQRIPGGSTQMGARGIQRSERLAKQLMYFSVNKIKKLWMDQINFTLNKHLGKGDPLL